MDFDILFTGSRNHDIGYARVCDFCRSLPVETMLVPIAPGMELDWGWQADAEDLASLADILLSEALPEESLDSEWRNDDEWDRLIEEFATEVIGAFRYYGWSIWRAEIVDWVAGRKQFEGK